jgi:peroxiredoxin
MLATLCLMSCALAPTQAASGSEWLLTPRLSRGQELVYRGTFTEESLGRGVQFLRSYRLQSRVFVLDSSPDGADVAFFTTLKLRTGADPANVAQASPENGSIRLETVRLNPQGRVLSDRAAELLVPLNGPATAECQAIVEVPKNRVGANQRWEVLEAGRPARIWTVAGLEPVNGTSCVKITGIQQSEDWDQPRADRTAWRRQDVVWLSPRFGIAYRVERTIEQREPARREATQRMVTRFELENTLVYPGQLFEDRYREIRQYQSFVETAAPLWHEPGKYPAGAYEALLAKINAHVESRPPTPYREAIVHLRGRVEAVRSGHVPLATVPDAGPRPVAAVGQLAPDFVVNALTTKQPVRLQRLLGRPILLVFYSPSSRYAEELLRFVQGLQDKNAADLTVLGLAVSEDNETVLKQYADLKLQIPLAAGKGLRQTYAVESTPKLVVLDADGVVRGAYIGWGREIPDSVAEELKRWQRPGR